MESGFVERGFENDFIPPVTSVNSGLELEVLPDLYMLTCQVVNVFFIGNPRNNEFILVDAGMPLAEEMIFDVVEKRFGPEAKPKYILLTHGHFDHVGTLAELLQRWDVPVYVHELELPYLNGQANYPPCDPSVNGGLVAKMSMLFPNHGIDLGEQVQVLPADGSLPDFPEWTYISTPGHTPGHISLFRPSDGTLIAGDAFVTVDQESLFSVIHQELELNGPPAYYTTDWNSAWNSVKKLASLNPSLAVTGHGLPLSGEKLQQDLNKLANNFNHLAIPKHGKYVDGEQTT